MSVDWISKKAEDMADKHGDGDVASEGNPEGALTLHVNNVTFELLVNLMQEVGCDLQKMPIDNGGDFVDGETARTWAKQMSDARPNMVLVKLLFDDEDTYDPSPFDLALALAGTFNLAEYIHEHNARELRWAASLDREPEPLLEDDDLTVDEGRLDDLEGEDAYFREMIDQAIALLRDGDGFYQW